MFPAVEDADYLKRAAHQLARALKIALTSLDDVGCHGWRLDTPPLETSGPCRVVHGTNASKGPREPHVRKLANCLPQSIISTVLSADADAVVVG